VDRLEELREDLWSRWRAALLVFKLAPESLKIADCFIAYAIDWEFEFHDMLKILKQCGASAATLRKLKKIGCLH